MLPKDRELISLGDNIWKNSEKINSEILALTYGVIVEEACRELQNADEVNKRLEKMGFDIGSRLIEDFLARSCDFRCTSLKETAEIMAKVAFKVYLGITPSLIFSTEDGCEFTLHLDDNPLAVFVELPKNLIRTLWYSNILCGVIRGALEMINIKVETFFISDTLNGDAATEIKVKVISTGGEYTIQDD